MVLRSTVDCFLGMARGRCRAILTRRMLFRKHHCGVGDDLFHFGGCVVARFQGSCAVEDLVMGRGPRIPTWKSLTYSEKLMHARRCGFFIYSHISGYYTISSYKPCLMVKLHKEG